MVAIKRQLSRYGVDLVVIEQPDGLDPPSPAVSFRHGDESLDDAQLAKKHHIAAKLFSTSSRPHNSRYWLWLGRNGFDPGEGIRRPRNGHHAVVRAVGRGSRPGGEVAPADLARFEFMDYRDLHKRFDRVASVGMMEHVGVVNYDTFFRAVRNSLHDDGVALIHHIGRSDGPNTTSQWLQKYIFPGGYAPPLNEVTPAIERSGLMVTDIEALRVHYALTLRLWRERFAAHRKTICSLYDERFCRMFEFYLTGAELAFRRQKHVVFQIQLSVNQFALPINREYMLPRATREQMNEPTRRKLERDDQLVEESAI